MREPDKTYSTRGNAVRAARAACRKALGSPIYQAFEGPDYEIHPYSGPDGWGFGKFGEDRYYFRLRGPALEAMEKTR